MSTPTLSSHRFTPAMQKSRPVLSQTTNPTLAANITLQASSQTYYTIRLLADPAFRETAYQAYAYFRWVDDMIDREVTGKKARLAFLDRQQAVIAQYYRGNRVNDLHPMEQMVAGLIQSDTEPNSGLETYINSMMAVMTFDAERRGQPVTQAQLALYTHLLATAVTELLHHCIGHNDATPQDESRYSAVTGAHVTHLLRDTVEDTAAGFYNIPREYLTAHQIGPTDLAHEAYRAWVKERVQMARECFKRGRGYMARIENFRCRLAGYAYIGRFEVILDAIERDNYYLRPAYPERKSKKNVLKISFAAVAQAIKPAKILATNYTNYTNFVKEL